MRHVETPVLIVGGSLVGLSMSVFLAHHGVQHLVVERHPGTAIHPRAAFLMQRTVELFRGVGLQEEVIAAAEREFEQNGAIVAVESLSGRELQWFFENINEGVEHLSPSPRIFVTQIGLEPVLRARAAALGGQLRYSCELVSLQVEEDGVTALVRDRGTGEESTVRAAYAVAADGVRSAVRQQLGIQMAGHGSFSDSITIYFRGDVRPLLRGRNLSVVYVVNPRLQGFFRFSFDGRSGFLVVNSALDGDGNRTTAIGATATEADCVRYVRDALGAPDLPVEIEDVQRWNAAAEWAGRFRAGRVFLAGDSAHVMPPTGGYGGNTGVHDAHNLAWKLAHVLDGRAGADLLDTYQAERLPVARMTVEQAYTRYVTRLDPGLGTDGLEPVIDDALIDLGYRYRSRSIVDDDVDVDAEWEDPRAPTGRPGVRAPHVTLRRGDTELSTLDVIGCDAVLFTGPDGTAWVRAVQRLGAPLAVCRVGAGGDVDDPRGEFAKAYGIGPSGASLVRPDGVVAWRAREAVDDAGEAVGAALARVFCR
ncbi:FAD-dependent monooxygenase [Phytohabitans sp. LJ34]|uniref:FAD-dependent monooxygenase n=1 Tax=Phytohabitans sp. LJ34 TaxID=3452217 RepID=UPI003F8C2BFD